MVEVDELFTKKDVSKSELIGFFEWNEYMYPNKRIIEFKEDNSFIYKEYGSEPQRCEFTQIIGFYHVQNDTILFTIDENNVYLMNEEGVIVRKEDFDKIIKYLHFPIIIHEREYKGILCLLDGLSYYFIYSHIDKIKKEQEKALFFYRKDNRRRSSYVFLKQ